MTREHGMTFRPDMAAAIRGGRKTQTRRLIDPQPPQWAEGREIRHISGNLWGLFAVHSQAAACHSEDTIRCPWQVGDRIFVKEEWNICGWDNEDYSVFIRYRDDSVKDHEFEEEIGEWEKYALQSINDCEKAGLKTGSGNMFETPADGHLPTRWRPAKTMPSWAARTWLEITEIRAKRIRDVSESDAMAEGVDLQGFRSKTLGIAGREHVIEFVGLWESLYPGSWERNDFVWAYTFKEVKEGAE